MKDPNKDPDDSSSDEDPDGAGMTSGVALSPNTRHREKEAQILENTEKLSPFKTYLTLIKGFIVTGIIYYPRNVILGGWGW